MSPYLASLGGGLLIGLAAASLLVINGRIAGISGVAAGLLTRPDRDTAWRALFLLGLLVGPWAYAALAGRPPVVQVDGSWPLLIVGGLLVGFGTRLGSGCTSGHGVCGLARLSPRSIVAVATFMVSAACTVFLMRHGISR